MSNTNKDKIRGKYKRARNKSNEQFDLIYKRAYKMNPDFTSDQIWHLCKKINNHPWDHLTEEQKLIVINYSKAPSWWNHIFHIRPSRRNDHELLQTIQRRQSTDDIDESKFSLSRKPFKYYW